MADLDKIYVMRLSDKELNRASHVYWSLDFDPGPERALVYHRRGLIMSELQIRHDFRDRLVKRTPLVQPG